MRIKFGTDGWRGIIASDFTFENVKLVAQAISNHLQKNTEKEIKSIAVGFDTRFHSENFADAAASVFCANNIMTYRLNDFTPTPITAFCVKDLGIDGALMITASHNPYYYNGLKFIPHYAGPANAEITADIEKQIADISSSMLEVKSVAAPVSSEYYMVYDALPDYIKHIKRIVDFDLIGASGLKVFADVMNGASSAAVIKILNELELDFDVLNTKRDVRFSERLPDPSEKNLEELKARVVNSRANLAFALDGDGDRFSIIDENGRYFSPNEIISIILFYMAKHRKASGYIARTVATTHLLDDIARDFGLGIYETPVGFKYICERMLAGNVAVGGEESGGISVAGHIPEKDGILGSLLILEACSHLKSSPSAIMDEINSRYGYRYFRRIDVRGEFNKEKFYDELRNSKRMKCSDLAVKSVNDMDGIKFIFNDDAWMLFRLSGTEQMVRVYLESRSSHYFGEMLKLVDMVL